MAHKIHFENGKVVQSEFLPNYDFPLLNFLEEKVGEWKNHPTHTMFDYEIPGLPDFLFLILESFCKENDLHVEKTFEGLRIWGERREIISYVPIISPIQKKGNGDIFIEGFSEVVRTGSWRYR